MAPIAGPTWAAPAGPWTERQLIALPDDGHRYEIIDGCLIAHPPLDDVHQGTIEQIVDVLRGTAPPGWLPISRVGLSVGGSFLLPDATVLRPGTPADARWADPGDVALVVEVESAHSRRLDRCVKPGVYAEAGIESYWRVERTDSGAVAHLYTRAAGGHYQLHRSVQAGQCVTAELPYAVQVAPAAWH